jgi:hypothetical protein
MASSFPLRLYRFSAFAFTLLVPLATRGHADQPPTPQSKQESANQLGLPVAEEKDSYEIYSLLLRSEMPPQWNITAWAITQRTQTYPHHLQTNGFFGTCLDPAQNQRAIYLPLIENYVLRNKTSLMLERRFDLPQYELVAPDVYRLAVPFKTSVIFHVSVVAFNPARTRALVYVGHHCGSLCGTGRYHFLVRKDGQWQRDQEYLGITCVWAS